MNKKLLISLGIALLAIILAIAGFLFFRSRGSSSQTSNKIAEKVNTVPVSDRPYVTLKPTQEKHPAGTEVEITIHTTTLDSTDAEYELEYQAGSLLQGVFGSIDFTKEKPPVSKTLLLGTCSAGGKCDYNKEVSGGTVLIRLSGGQQKFAVKGEWSYQLMGDRDGQFSSRDSKFRAQVPPKSLATTDYVIVMQTMGLPKEVPGTILAGPYHIATLTKNTISADLEIRLSEEATDATLYGWTGSSWKEYKSEISDKMLSATVDRLTTFVVTASPLTQ